MIARAALLAGLVALGGCAARLPGAPVPAVPGAWSDATAGGELPGADWWAGFGSVELLDLQRQAARANLDVAAAVARLAQARGAARVAGAGRWPTVDLDAGVQRGNRGGGGDFGGGFGDSGGDGGGGDGSGGDFGGGDRAVSNRYQVGIVARYELDLWGRQRALARGGQARTRARQADVRAAQLSVQAEVALAYFRALALTARVHLADERIALARERLSLVQARRRLGSASDVELRAEESTLAGLLASVPTLTRDARLQRHALAVLLGLTPQAAPEPAARFADLSALPVPAGLPATVLARRPDVASAQAELLGAQADAAAAHAALLPSFSLTAQGGGSSSALGDVLASDGRFWTLGLDVLTPLLEGGRLRGARDQADAQTDERIALYRAAVLTALREVEDALATQAQSLHGARAQRQVVDALRAAQALADARRAAGASDRVAQLDAQRQTLEARDADVVARLAELEASVALFRAVGGGYSCTATPCDAADARLECAPFSGCGVEQPGSSSGS